MQWDVTTDDYCHSGTLNQLLNWDDTAHYPEFITFNTVSSPATKLLQPQAIVKGQHEENGSEKATAHAVWLPRDQKAHALEKMHPSLRRRATVEG